jgi:hypothetical protein
VRRTAFILVMSMLVVGIGVAVALSSQELAEPIGSLPFGLPGPSDPGSESAPPTAAVAAPAPLAYGAPNTPSPSDTGQSRLWFQDGQWWGVFLSAATGDQRIFRLDPAADAWSDTGVVVDDRSYARMDVLWDGERLVIASAGPQPSQRHALRIIRFSWDPSARAYMRDANFPLPITELGVEGVTLARSEDGRLWVAYRQGGRMAVDHSLDSDLAWRGPFALAAAEGPVERVALATMGARVAVIWTRPTEDVVFAAWNDITGPEDIWQQSPDVPLAGLSLGEDDLSVVADRSPGAERLFVAVRTSADLAPNGGRLDPQVVVMELTPNASPKTYLVGRVDDQLAGPIALLNSETRQLYIVAAVPKGGGAIYYKAASLDRITFPSGPGTLLVAADAQHPRLAKPTSTKQALDDTSGMVVAGTDTGAGLYAFGALNVGDGTPGTPAPAASSPATTALVDNTFDGLAVGAQVPGWTVEGEPPPAFVIRVLSGSDSSARLSSSTIDSRACVAFGDVSSGVLRVEAETLTNMASTDELRLLQVRGTAGELASIRLRDGQVVYGDGAVRVRSGLVLAPGRWYRSALVLDLGSLTYAIEIRNGTDDSILLQAEGLGWRSTDAPIANRACAELPPQPGLDLYLNNVRVTSSPAEGS